MSERSWRGAAWEVGLEHYRVYIEETGGPAIPVDYVCPDGFRLGRWVNTQRVHRRAQKLKPERFEILDALGLQWDPGADLQRSMIQALSDFHRAEGHVEVHHAHVTDSGLTLGKWLSAQRARHAKGTLKPEIVAELESLGVRWGSRTDTLFEQGLTELRRYIESTGATHVQGTHITSSGFALGRWFHTQKNAMTKDMSSERRARLEALGVRPDRDVREEAWQSAFDLLASWVTQHGHVNMTRDYVTDDGFRLGQWLWVQRGWLKSGRLKEHRRRQLDALLPDWYIVKPTWTTSEGLEALREAATMAFPLSASDYTDLRSQRLVEGPSHAWFIHRFHSWTAACAAADVEAGTSREGWTPYSPADIAQALEDFFDSYGPTATLGDYDAWARCNGAPSAATVMRRHGVWSEILGRFAPAGQTGRNGSEAPVREGRAWLGEVDS